MNAFWNGFEKEANAATDAFKGMAKAVGKTKAPKSLDGVLDYAKMKAPQAPHAPTLDYGSINKIQKAAPSGATLDYSSQAMKAKPAASASPTLSAQAQARINHATKSKSTRTDWKDALEAR